MAETTPSAAPSAVPPAAPPVLPLDATGPAAAVLPPAPSLSPSRRAWQRFKRNRLGYWSLVVFCVLVLLSLAAELLSNDKPLLVRYEGRWYVPLVQTLPETTFGGDFDTPTDYLDPFIDGEVPAGKQRLCVATLPQSNHGGRAKKIINAVVARYPERFESRFL